MTDIKRRNFLLALTGSVSSTQRSNTSPKLYVQHHGSIPTVDFDTWSLTVQGLSELTLKWQDMRWLTAVETARTLACIGNPVGGGCVGNAVWKGIRLLDVLPMGIIPADSTSARLTALDGYETAVSLDQLLHPDTLLAYQMNGVSLPREHGYPIRLLVGGTYGSKMPKWISKIEFINYEFKGYWESRGWSNRAEVQTHTLIFSPKSYEKIRQGVEIQGIAFAGYREIVSVEVRIDGGEWIPASLSQNETPLAWTQWSLVWQPAAPGKYTLEVRATDSAGFTQFAENHRLHNKPNGASAIHKIVVEVVA
ncbi:MAG: molybdopterin-dependent oxidoreductase [Anaerolineae bacterium]|nr:molybdopterin-dependent oxidoreductase [Anaerolineae bacterium]